MRLEIVDQKRLPKTSFIDGAALYANPIKLIIKFFLKRNELCINLLDVRSGNILDIGCGNGILLPTLSKVNGMIIGLDIHESLPSVKTYLNKNNFKNISLIQADTHSLPFKRSTFNSILLISTFDHLHKPRLALNELNRTIIPKGTVIFGFHVNNIGYYVIRIIFNFIYIISSFLVFHNFKEVLSHFLFKSDWRHLYSDSLLTQWISERLSIEEKKYLRVIYPVFVAIKSISNKKD